MVLVDSSQPDQSLRTEELAAINALGWRATVLALFGFLRMRMPVPAGNPESRDRSMRFKQKGLLATTRSVRAMGSGLMGRRDSTSEVAVHPPKLGNKPLVVLAEGSRRAWFWHQPQEKLTILSVASEWQVADNAGHLIHQDRRGLVIDAIRRTVDWARSRTPERVRQSGC